MLEAYHSLQLQRLQKIRFDLQVARQTDCSSKLERLWKEVRAENTGDLEALSQFTAKVVSELENNTSSLCRAV
jgi:hypothetical protein